MNKFVKSAVMMTALYGGVATLPLAAYAQAVPPDAAQAQTQYRARTPRLPSERIEARLAYVKTALKITPAQEPQWNTLANVMRAQARAMDSEMTARRAEKAAAGTTPAPRTAIDRLESRQKMLTLAVARTNDVLTAAKPLYATLNDDQKKIADDLLSRDRGSRRGHHR
jgi:protein CpxP